MKEDILKNRSFKFSLDIINLYKSLQEKNEFVISKQLLRSATSIWANIIEARNWQSKKDFLSKIYIAFKEANETRYWLELLNESKIVDIKIANYLNENDEIIKMLSSTIKTLKINNWLD